ncbi:MarR family transcriptional regulator [Curtobacterium sp. NPDC089185]|uniref:MarR family winged helix-turn-helix transcriptional regulator n=1 Tax=Curtobacterium sp. NPDC089185 TaxID=3154968 RepID=UPI00341FAEBF
MTDPRTDVLEALRSYAIRYQESAHHLAAFLDLPMNDGAALGEILWAENEGNPLSAARLHWRIGMTSGATNALIKRLEARGLVTRTRESEDRRIVTLRATDDARLQTAPFLHASADDLQGALASYSDTELATHAAFLRHFASVLPQSTSPSTD